MAEIFYINASEAKILITFNKGLIWLVIPFSLSAFTHFWNLTGFPQIHWDEHTYIIRGMFVGEGLGLIHDGLYDHPFFGWIFLGTLLKATGYFASLNVLTQNLDSITSSFSIPRILMGVLALLDTFLVYKIGEKKYNPIVGLIAAILFSVTPLTWMLRRVMLEPIQLPFILASILLPLYLRSGAITSRDALRQRSIIAISGILLGTAILTKVPAFTMIPVVAYLVFQKTNNKLRSIALLSIPIILIPLLWPIYALSVDQLDEFFDGILAQSQRSLPGRPTFYFEQALAIIFSIDPAIFILGLAGSFLVIVLEFPKRNYTFVFWVVPFLIYASLIGYVTDFHFILLYPAMSIAAGVLIYRAVSLLKAKPKIRISLLSILVFSVAAFGLVNTTLIISSDKTSGMYKSMSTLARQIQDNDPGGVILGGQQTLFSYPIQYKNINYIECTFRMKDILDPNDNWLGVVWADGKREPLILMRGDQLVFFRSIFDPVTHPKDYKYVSAPANRQDEEWYTLKIIYDDKAMSIFLDNVLKMQVPTLSENNILKVGIATTNVVAEFGPIMISSEGTTLPLDKEQVSYNLLDFTDNSLLGGVRVEDNRMIST